MEIPSYILFLREVQPYLEGLYSLGPVVADQAYSHSFLKSNLSLSGWKDQRLMAGITFSGDQELGSTRLAKGATCITRK